MLGPAKSAKSTNGISVRTRSSVVGIAPGPPTTRRMPPQEMANTRA